MEPKNRARSALIAVVMVISLVAPLLGGCGGTSSTGPTVDEVTQAAERLSGWLRINVSHEGQGQAGHDEDEFLSLVDGLYDWPQIGLVRYDGNGFADFQAVTTRFVRESWQGDDGFRTVTDLERLTLSISAGGGDARDVGGHDLIAALCNHSRFDMQGVNSPIFGLIALDCGDYAVPEGALWTRDRMLARVLEYRNADGSLDLSGSGGGDPDITAMALQALWRYADEPGVEETIADALEWLSETQLPDGGYSSWGAVNSESASQVIIALAALGLDATDEPDFVKEGENALSFLLSLQQADGSFKHTLDGGSDKTASEQAMLALTAWLRLRDGRSPLYDYVD